MSQQVTLTALLIVNALGLALWYGITAAILSGKVWARNIFYIFFIPGSLYFVTKLPELFTYHVGLGLLNSVGFAFQSYVLYFALSESKLKSCFKSNQEQAQKVSKIGEIEKFHQLHKIGALTDAEFEAEKKILLARTAA